MPDHGGINRSRKKEMIIKMKQSGKLSNEDIADITGFTVKEVEDVSKKDIVPV